ncbi:39S ribosomal protein L50 [Nephila pilipes]|uniref:Large ribosomal subunit protein mL50 n=1 Tax=Nephila pilipes TaxID=299642 RepID=A0A8X6U3U3_NEPPI|nr:39S ribosomal protein L50 [Nephila pilipes]
MNSLKFCSLYKDYQIIVRNTQKISAASAHILTSKGTRMMRKARKYKRPEEKVDPYYYGIGPKEEVKEALQSMIDRGISRELPSYQPPADVDQQLHKICKKIFGSELSSDWKTQLLNDPLLKYKVLTKCIETFKKSIPNSSLHKMKNVEDLLAFYNTPIEGHLPYDALVRKSELLPPNLHIMSDTKPFNPTNDTFFDGVTAYPGRKRIIYTKTGEKFEKVIEWPHI